MRQAPNTVIITYTDKQFTLNVTDEQGDTILEMSAADVQFKMDLTKMAINSHKLTKLISDMIKSE